MLGNRWTVGSNAPRYHQLARERTWLKWKHQVLPPTDCNSRPVLFDEWAEVPPSENVLDLKMRLDNIGVGLLLFAALQGIPSSDGANILFFFQVSTYSHRIVVWPLVEALAERGHNVTFLTVFHPRHPNEKVREFFPESLQRKVMAKFQEQPELFGDLMSTRLNEGRVGTIKSVFSALPVLGIEICQAFLEAPETVEFQSETFDLVIIDSLFNECGFGFAYSFGAKTILFGTTHPFSWTTEAMGVVTDTSIYSELLVSFSIPLNFWEKLMSTLIIPGIYYLKTWFYYPQLDSMFRKRFNDPHMPSIEELERQTSLVLFNSHFSEEEARALPPMFIPIGGLHCDWAHGKKQQKPMPTEIAKFIKESGDEGFIYISFGSEAKLGGTLPEFQKIFYTATRNSKIRFIWKWEGPRPKEMPPNVLTAEWMPQQQILASEKCRAFITHGGLLSMHEAISYGVPMISVPIFAEQDFNSFRLERKRRGIRLEASTLTLEHLQHAIAQILTNPIYKENVEEASRLFKDRPETPLQTAIFWTEYVLRHNDTSVLKPIHAMEQFWFQRRLLDVWAFIFISLGTFIYAIYLITVYFVFVVDGLFP